MNITPKVKAKPTVSLSRSLFPFRRLLDAIADVLEEGERDQEYDALGFQESAKRSEGVM